MAYREGNIEAGGVSMDGILDGKPGMTIDELIALLEKGPIKAESNNEDKAEIKQVTATSRKIGGIFIPNFKKVRTRQYEKIIY